MTFDIEGLQQQQQQHSSSAAVAAPQTHHLYLETRLKRDEAVQILEKKPRKEAN